MILPAKKPHEHVMKYVLRQLATTNALLDEREKLRPILAIDLSDVMHGSIFFRVPAKLS
jgi:hypothetical protein